MFLLFALHLIFTLQSPAVPYDAHFLFREVNYIQETGSPFIEDLLSYQGRIHIISLIFPYFATLLSLLLPDLGLLFALQILFSIGSVILLFNAASALYTRYWIATVLAILTATSTILFIATRETANPLQLFILFYLMLLWQFFKLPSSSTLFALIAVVATLTSPLSLVLIAGALIYLLLLFLEGLQFRKEELEPLGFSVVFILWFHLIVYKEVLVSYGSSVIWQSIPRELLSSFFQSLSLPIFIQLIGLIPLLLGLYGMYEALFIKRKRSILFVVAMTIASGTLLLFGYLPLIYGISITTLNFILLAGFGLQRLVTFLNKTRFSNGKKIMTALVIVLSLIFFISTLLSFNQTTGVIPAEKEFLSTVHLEDATILGTVEQGHALSYYTNQKNFYDTRFIFAPQPQQRYEDALKLFQAKSTTTILEITQNYGITHIYVSPQTHKQFNTQEFYFENNDCFPQIAKDSQYKLYEIQCSLKE